MHHPVFQGKPVNTDPREAFVARLLAEEADYNVFHDLYRRLVRALYEAGVTRNVYCVNIDAVIACLLLKVLWEPYRSGERAGTVIRIVGVLCFAAAVVLNIAAH